MQLCDLPDPLLADIVRWLHCKAQMAALARCSRRMQRAAHSALLLSILRPSILRPSQQSQPSQQCLRMHLCDCPTRNCDCDCDCGVHGISIAASVASYPSAASAAAALAAQPQIVRLLPSSANFSSLAVTFVPCAPSGTAPLGAASCTAAVHSIKPLPNTINGSPTFSHIDLADAALPDSTVSRSVVSVRYESWLPLLTQPSWLDPSSAERQDPVKIGMLANIRFHAFFSEHLSGLALWNLSPGIHYLGDISNCLVYETILDSPDSPSSSTVSIRIIRFVAHISWLLSPLGSFRSKPQQPLDPDRFAMLRRAGIPTESKCSEPVLAFLVGDIETVDDLRVHLFAAGSHSGMSPPCERLAMLTKILLDNGCDPACIWKYSRLSRVVLNPQSDIPFDWTRASLEYKTAFIHAEVSRAIVAESSEQSSRDQYMTFMRERFRNAVLNMDKSNRR